LDKTFYRFWQKF